MTAVKTEVTASDLSARIDRLPPSRHLFGQVCLIGTGGWFEFFQLALPGYISLGLINSHLFTKTASGPLGGIFDLSAYASFVAAFPAGMWFGTILLGRLSDRFGRKIVFTIPMLAYSVMMLITACIGSPALVDALRFLCGIAVGIQLINNDAWMSEITPRAVRGRYIAASFILILTSYPFAALLGYLLVPHAPLGMQGWRWLVLIGGVMGLLVIWVRRRVPESPRWLAARGCVQEAEEILERIESQAEHDTGKALPEPDLQTTAPVVQKGAWTEMFHGVYGRRTFMMSVFQFMQTVSFFGFTAWVPVFLLSKGLNTTSSLLYTFAIALLTPVGAVVASVFADRIERKWQLVAAGALIAVMGMVFAAVRTPVGIVVLGGLVTIGNFWMIGIFHTYNAEIFPTRIRSQAVSFTFSWSRLSGVFVGYVISSLFAAHGTGPVFAMIAGAMVILMLAVGILGPRTNGQSLEKLAK